jgi:hypothetical protein
LYDLSGFRVASCGLHGLGRRQVVVMAEAVEHLLHVAAADTA